MSQFRLSCWWIVYAFDPHQPMVEKVEFLSFSFCLLSFSQLYNKLMWQWILAIVCSCECWFFFFDCLLGFHHYFLMCTFEWYLKNCLYSLCIYDIAIALYRLQNSCFSSLAHSAVYFFMSGLCAMKAPRKKFNTHLKTFFMQSKTEDTKKQHRI